MSCKYLNYKKSELIKDQSIWTAKEITQQPMMWRKAQGYIDENKLAIDEWLAPILTQTELRIILTGAGSSSFIGEILAPSLRRKLGKRVEAISTTNLVGAPHQYLAEDVPTLLISFGRSGDSPESIASIDLSNKILTECHHLIFTCNSDGYLSKFAKSNPYSHCILMPELCNDKSLAMTSSFTSMLVSCASVFLNDKIQMETVAQLSENLLNNKTQKIQELANTDYNRLVVLGSGSLQGAAMEAALKSLELTAGKVTVMFESSLGFRHGPKSVVNVDTVIIQLQSVDEHLRKYDQNLIDELKHDNITEKMIVLSPEFYNFGNNPEVQLSDLWLSLPYLVYCQILAFYKARSLNIYADNPSPNGEINRVVQGVTIHDLEASVQYDDASNR